MATVEVAFTPLPAHVRTARLVATAVARRSGVDEELLDEVRLAVGEACSRAVEAHRRHCPAEPIRIEMSDLGERFEVIVRDAVPSNPAQPVSANGTAHQPAAAAASFPAGFGLAVISGLADDVRISATGTGVSVRMTWPCLSGGSAPGYPLRPVVARRYRFTRPLRDLPQPGDAKLAGARRGGHCGLWELWRALENAKPASLAAGGRCMSVVDVR